MLGGRLWPLQRSSSFSPLEVIGNEIILGRAQLRFGRAENFDLRDTLDMTDECILVFLSVHFRPRASSQRLDFGDEHRRSLAGQESIDFRAQQSFVAQRAHALHAGGFGDPGNVRSGGSLASRTAAATEKLLVIKNQNIKIFWLARTDYGQDARREQHAAVGIKGKDSAFRQSRGQTESHLT